MKRLFVGLALLALCPDAYAASVPSAGSQVQQIPDAPKAPKAAPKIQIDQDDEPAVAVQEQVRIPVNSLRLTGNVAFTKAELVGATNFSPGSELTLADLRAMAAKIADYYRSQGYFVAQAYLPAQEIVEGVVTIAVLEGSYGEINLRNSSDLSDSLANSLLDDLDNGDAITIAPLESRLLLLSDLPGVEVRSTLAPGVSVGSSDLIVDVTPGRRVTGHIYADNQGSRYTGENRIGTTVNFNEPFGQGDVTSLRVLTSASGLDYARVSHQLQLGRTRVGVAYASMDYELGREFESLQAHGTAKIASLYGSYPLIRQRNNNLNVQVNFDDKTFEDRVDSTATVTDKDARVLMTSINGDHRDDFGGGGLSSYSLTWTSGRIDIRSPDALAADESAAETNGRFDKLGFEGMRLQRLTDLTSLYFAISGQYASKNLDISEKMQLGGANAVRAYPEGEAYGDQGYVASLEVRRQLQGISERLPGQMQLIGFVDTGSVELDKKPFAEGENRRTLSAAGIGLDWTDSDKFTVKAYFAHKLGSAEATSAPDESNRFWLQAVRYF